MPTIRVTEPRRIQMAMTPEQLAATKPQRDQFETEEEWDEAVTYWMSRQGRSPMLRKLMQQASPSTTSSTKSSLTDTSESSDPAK
tara:strand:- start:758 stop:1012 length:255 start_codon:yes stop_codon:yes gene_type:complete